MVSSLVAKYMQAKRESRKKKASINIELLRNQPNNLFTILMYSLV